MKSTRKNCNRWLLQLFYILPFFFTSIRAAFELRHAAEVSQLAARVSRPQCTQLLAPCDWF